MEQQKRIEYNKQYYQKHKEDILTRATAKIQCQFCNRIVSNNNLQKHFTLPICKNTQLKNKFITDRQTKPI